MAASLTNIEVARVYPLSDSTESLTLPLTCFDILWFKLPPVKRVIFYKHTELTREFYDSVVIPRLKSSLSLVLSHYLPLAGRLVWDQPEPKPRIVYCRGDAVSLSVSESAADFYRLSGDGPRGATELYPLVPELPTSDNSASIFSLQVTLFPNQGFCIALSAHHAVLDGKSTIMFLKAWAHACKHQEHEKSSSPSSLPQDLIPFYDRTVINVPAKVEMDILNVWLSVIGKFTGEKDLNKLKNLNCLPSQNISPDVTRTTFELTRENIQTLRERIRNASEKSNKELRLSNFVIALSYVFTSMVKVRGGDPERPILIGFAVDCRSRLDPPIPENYFGNGVGGVVNIELKASQFMEEKGFIFAIETVSELVLGLENWTPDGLPNVLNRFFSIKPGSQMATVAGSARFGVYGSDFGWGRPVKVEIVSIDENGAISMAESRDGSGGVEIGLSLPRHEVEILIPLLRDGLKN